MSLVDAHNLLRTMKSDYFQSFKKDSSKKEVIKGLDKEYTQRIKELTQDQRKIMLAILNPQKYGTLDLKDTAERTVKGREKLRGVSRAKKTSRALQNVFGSRISSQVVQRELHKWAQNESNKISVEDF